MLAVLLDPDQCRGSVLASTIAALKSNVPEFIFVGGSHTVNCIDSLIELLKEEIKTNKNLDQIISDLKTKIK